MVDFSTLNSPLVIFSLLEYQTSTGDLEMPFYYFFLFNYAIILLLANLESPLFDSHHLLQPMCKIR